MSEVNPEVAWASEPKRAQMKGGVESLIGMTPKGSQFSRLRSTRDIVGRRSDGDEVRDCVAIEVRLMWVNTIALLRWFTNLRIGDNFSKEARTIADAAW